MPRVQTKLAQRASAGRSPVRTWAHLMDGIVLYSILNYGICDYITLTVMSNILKHLAAVSISIEDGRAGIALSLRASGCASLYYTIVNILY